MAETRWKASASDPKSTFFHYITSPTHLLLQGGKEQEAVPFKEEETSYERQQIISGLLY